MKRNTYVSTYKVCLFSCVFLSSVVSYSQTAAQITDIENTLEKATQFSRKNLDSAAFYSNEALSKAKLIKNDSLIAKSQLQKSLWDIQKRDFDKANALLNEVLEIKELPLQIKGQLWRNFGTLQFYQQKFEQALEFYLKAAAIFEKADAPALLADTYSNIGILNASLRKFDKATTYLEKALKYSVKEDALHLKIISNLSTLYSDTKAFDKFEPTALESEQLAKKLNSKRVLASLYTNLTQYYTEEKQDYKRALTYGQQSVKLKKAVGFHHSLSISYNNIGYAYLKNKEYQKAITYLDSAIQVAKGFVSPIVYNNIKDAYRGLGAYQKALHFAELEEQLKDSISKAAQNEKVSELIEKYESEKKEQEILTLDTKNQLQKLTIKQQQYWFVAIAFFGMLLLGIGYFGFRNFKTKQELDKVVLKQNLLKSQLNPHFLFNALQSIQNFIHQNDKTKSSAYLSNYAKLIRLVLENSDQQFVTVHDDRLAIESYLNLQQLTHNNSFTYTISVDEAVDVDFDSIPPLISQPFVENAVLHGVKNIPNGYIAVRYYKDGSTLCLSIHDNGKGFVTKEKDEKRLHKSMSLHLIKEQFETLSQMSKNFKGEILTDNSSGTKVVLRIMNT